MIKGALFHLRKVYMSFQKNTQETIKSPSVSIHKMIIGRRLTQKEPAKTDF